MEATVGIGINIQRKDAFDKVNGSAKYNIDYTSPRLLHAKMLTSPYAHARIKAIDISEAKKMPGVQAVITGKAYPGLVGVLYEDRPIIAQDKVRYHGEPVAVVVADTLYEAVDAAKMIKVEYEPLPVVNSVHQAVRPDSPLVHENMSHYRILKPTYPLPNTNIANHIKIRKGDMNKGWAESEIILEESFSLPQGDHVAMEQRNARAEIQADGRVVIHTSSQSPFIVRKLISRYFGIDDGKVVVNTPLVGGAFGGKAAVQLELIAYLATQAVGGRMVKLTNTREEDMITSPVRIGLEAKIKLGAAKDGTIKAAEITYLYTGLPYKSVKKTRQGELEYPLVSVAAIKRDGHIRFSFSGVCPFPFRSAQIEVDLNNTPLTAAERINNAISHLPAVIVNDIQGSAEYRQFVLTNTLKDILISLEGVI